MDAYEAPSSRRPTRAALTFRALQSPDVDAARTQRRLVGLALDIDVKSPWFQAGNILVNGNLLVFGMRDGRNDRMRAREILPRRQFHAILVHRFGGVGHRIVHVDGHAVRVELTHDVDYA